MKITAAVTRAIHAPQSLESIELAEPGDSEILVRVVATGVCHTDIAMRDQTFPVPQPIVLGHEGAGIVERTGRSVSKVAVGDHVVMTYNSCGRCDSCRENLAGYCHDFFGRNFSGGRPDGTSPLSVGAEQIHGNFFGQSSFASYAICHERNAVVVPKDAPLERLGPLACGIQTGAGAVINALRVRAGQSIAVFGTGSVGLSAIMAARVVGAATIVAVDKNVRRLTMAKELGATHVMNPDDEDVVAGIIAITGAGTNYAFETTGIAGVIRNAVECLAPRGMCGIVGASKPGSEITVDAMHLMTGGRTIRGIIEGDSVPDLFIPQLIELNRQGRFPFERMIQFYEMTNINQAIDDAESGIAIKPVIRMTVS